MSLLGDIFEELNIAKEKIAAIVEQLKVNPMGAMAMVQELNLPAEANQKIMATVMMNPGAIDELAAEIGVDAEVVEAVKKKLQGGEG